jgi:hypothetical protein
MSGRSHLVLFLRAASKPALYLALVAGCVGATIGADQPTPFGTSTNAFSVTQSVLKAFYPEVYGKERYLLFSAEQPVDSETWGQFTRVDFTIKRFSWNSTWNVMIDGKTGKEISPPENTKFLEGKVQMFPHGDLWQMDFVGELAHSKENEVIAMLVQSHSEWSDERAGRALKKAGALYGPADKDVFTRSLRLPDLERSLGLTILSADNAKEAGATTEPSIEFEGWTTTAHDSYFTGFVWTVRMYAGLAGGHARKYAFDFEPFEGKLVGIFQLPPDLSDNR